MLTVPFSFSEQSRAILEKSILARRERRGQAPGIRMILGVQGPARDCLGHEQGRNYFGDIVRSQLFKIFPALTKGLD